jgi:putative glycosyltransferase (TIGR04372 family)
MNKRSIYPIFTVLSFSNIILSICNAKINGYSVMIKQVLSYLVRYYFPRIIGILLFPVGIIIRNKLNFLRLDLDHFGPIICVYYFISSKNYDSNKLYFVLNCNFPSPSLLEGLPKNIIFIDNPLLWIISSGYFFCDPCSLQLAPIHHSYFNDVRVPFMDFEPLSRNTKKLYKSTFLFSKYTSRPKYLKDLLGNHSFIMLYVREPGWHMSAGKSLRNGNIKVFHKFLKYCFEKNIKVVRFGGDYMKPIEDYGIDNSLIIDYCNSELCYPENDIYLWANCSGVIGSMSGAMHVPSVLFGKLTLYVGLVPVHVILSHNGLVQNSGSIAENTYYALPKIIYNEKEISLSQRLLEESNYSSTTNTNSFYEHCKIKQFDQNFILSVGKLFLSELKYLDEEIKLDYKRYNLQSHICGNDKTYDILPNHDGKVILN